MNRIVLLKSLFPVLILLLSLRIVYSADFYVSPSGNDKNQGSREKPFATLRHTILAVENYFNENGTESCTVWLAGGEYSLTEPLILKAENLGNGKHNLLFKAVSGANPVISGGIGLTYWEKLPEGLWRTELPEMAGMAINPRELFINDERAIRARFPNEGFLRIKEAGTDRRTHFYFEKGDFIVPEDCSTLELVLLHDWSISRIQVKEIDVSESRLTAVDSIGAKNPSFFNLDHWEPQPRYYLENAMEFVDADYEWFYHQDDYRLYLKLPESVRPENLKITVPLSKGLIVLEGNEGQMIKNIHFDGIAFKHSSWELPEKGYCGVQACHFDPRPGKEGWSVVPAAVTATWAENCTFNNCSFMNLGGSAIVIGTGSRNCRVSNSLIADVSGNGIMIGEGRDRELNGDKWWKTAPAQAAQGNTIENCTITACGTQFYGAVGIWCGLTAETTLRNNHLYDLPYSGISVGWMWSPEPTPCRNNVIEGNHIHHIMQVLSDGGGIYMLGLQPGSKLTGNRIHDVSLNVGRAESNGMFLDEGTTDVVVAHNLIYSIAKSPLRFHKATSNLVEKNHLFCSGGNPPIRYNNTKEEDIRKVGNIIFSETDEGYSKELTKSVRQWEKEFR